MPLTGRDVWESIVKLGLMSGPYEPRMNRHCANADRIAELLNDTISKRQGWLPNLRDTEDAMKAWEANTPREYVLRLYKFLNQAGYTVVGIDAAIEREVRKNKSVSADATAKSRP
ncbi:MAG TPA: hypothetical protein VMF50_11820 [Candidatus Binataceae bacterium]|nr:hypothetical protein [Candidatus Binataceae bacterium]